MKDLTKKVIGFATHYTGAFVIVMAITLISCGFSIHYLATLESNLRDVYENDVRGGDAIQSAYVALLGIETSVKDLVLFPDPQDQDRARGTIHDRVAGVKAALNRAYPRFYTPKARQLMAVTLADLKGFFGVLDDTLGASENHRTLTGQDLAPLEEHLRGLEKDFNLLLANREANSHVGVGELVGELRFSLIVTVALVVVTVAIRLVMYVAGHPSRKNKAAPPPE